MTKISSSCNYQVSKLQLLILSTRNVPNFWMRNWKWIMASILGCNCSAVNGLRWIAFCSMFRLVLLDNRGFIFGIYGLFCYAASSLRTVGRLSCYVSLIRRMCYFGFSLTFFSLMSLCHRFSRSTWLPYVWDFWNHQFT